VIRRTTSLPENPVRVVPQGAAAQRRILPPVSAAAGGAMPGVDPAASSAVQEFDDLDHVERMMHAG
jgi:hypothetical protein